MAFRRGSARSEKVKFEAVPADFLQCHMVAWTEYTRDTEVGELGNGRIFTGTKVYVLPSSSWSYYI